MHGLNDNDEKEASEVSSNSPCSIYLYSNMAPRLLDQNCKLIFQVSFVSQFPKETLMQRKQHQIRKFVLI